MKIKTLKILYWIFTVIFSAFMILSAMSHFFPNEQGIAMMALLGYPLYLNSILGVAKVLGVVAILQNRFRTIKEWAYAGFTFDMIGAIVSFMFIGMLAGALLVLPSLVLMFLSYFLGKKLYN